MKTQDDDKPPLFLLFLVMGITLLLLLILSLTQKQPEMKLLPDIGLEDCFIRQPSVPVRPSYTIMACISAYNALPEQTDSTPFTMASGKRVYSGAVANNGLSFGTVVEIDGEQYVVEDRMNSRYSSAHFDIFMWRHNDAKEFGRQYQKVMVYK